MLRAPLCGGCVVAVTKGCSLMKMKMKIDED